MDVADGSQGDDEAFAWLEKAIEDRSSLTTWLNVDPLSTRSVTTSGSDSSLVVCGGRVRTRTTAACATDCSTAASDCVRGTGQAGRGGVAARRAEAATCPPRGAL